MKKEECSNCKKKNKLTLNTISYVCRYCTEKNECKDVVLDRQDF